MKKAILLFALAVSSFHLFATTTLSGAKAGELVQGADEVMLNDKLKTIQFIRFAPNAELAESQVESWLSDFQKRNFAGTDFRLSKSEVNPAGEKLLEYTQYYNGVKIEHSVLKVHARNGRVGIINGELYPAPAAGVLTGSLSQDAVRDAATAYYRSLKATDNNFDIAAAEKVLLYQNGKYTYCAKTDIYSHKPKPQRSYLYISLATGAVVYDAKRIMDVDQIGSATTLYNGTKPVTGDRITSSLFYLRETGARHIHTWNENHSTVTSAATEFTDADDIWTADPAAYSAHYSIEKTWDYYYSTYGRNSYDNAGATVNNYVHTDVNYVNAYWDGTGMWYGDGDGVTYTPLTSTDIAGHELTHAVTEYSANLTYQDESGALNESFSDIMGVTIDFYANPTTANFLEGDQVNVNGIPFRSMADPNLYGDPDTYQGTNWYSGTWDNGGVHTNSGVQNYWYYLLCQGGSGVNDLGHSFNITSIGMTKAAAIVYRSLTMYLTASSQYADARTYSIQAALDLYGACSNEVIQVTNAWYAVGVGAQYSNAVRANFTANTTYKCTVPATITFTNQSTNASTYSWSFGDGGTSTLASPSHAYTAPGIYTVRLIVSGSSACNSRDTMTRTSYITIVNGGAPIAATCTPVATSPSASYGITNVKLGTINNASSNAIEGYKDFTCNVATTLTRGSQYQLRITTQSTAEYTYAWIDFNNDGAFSSSEQIASFAYGTAVNRLAVVSIPASAPVLSTPLRMRVATDYTTLASGCANPYYGQAEDYTVTILAATAKPVANFAASDTVVSVGATVSFTDLSTNGPTAWRWTINGGTPTSSTTQNPSANFPTAGTYAIKLVASNSYGSDSITKTIRVVNSILMCSSASQTTTGTAGTIYDSGGPLGNYSNSESCSLLISPTGGCTDSIVLTITEFSTESCCDYLSIYNGTSTAGTLMLNAFGSLTLPYRVKVPSANMFLQWYSDGSVVYGGYTATWQVYQHATTRPTAAFTMTPANPPLLDTVFFTNTSSASASSYSWDFGDGATSTAQNPSHIYGTPGTYTVRLIAIACGGAADTVRHTVMVQASPNVVLMPASFNVSLGCRDSARLSLIIRDNSGGELDWNILRGAGSVARPNVLVWLYGVDTTIDGEYRHTMAAINQYYTNYNVATTNTITPSVLQGLLANKQVLLIPELETGSSTIVSPMASVIQGFVSGGGTLVQCGDYNGIFLSTGVFTGTIGTSLSSGTSLTTVNTSTPLTSGITGTVIAQNATSAASFTNAGKVPVVTYNSSDIITYLPYGSGKAIYLAYDFYAYDSTAAKFVSNAVRWGAQSGNGSSANLQVSPLSGDALAGQQDTVQITVNSTGLSGGRDTMYVVVQTNDLSHLLDTVPVYVTVSPLPCPAFGYTRGSSCSGVLQFRDSTLNAPTSWTWRFGDGSTATTQNPTHTYTAAGTYTVTLVVRNAAGTDSISRSITLSSVVGPLANSCTPVATAPNSSYGILNVKLNTINNTSLNASEGYKDFTCTQYTTLTASTQYVLNVTTVYAYEYPKVWIDYNNDGVFATTELVATLATGATAHQATIAIPASGPVLNTPLRMRVMSDYYNPATACTNPYYGQAEDYTVTITSATAAPVANFTMSDTLIGIGATDNFTDLSTNGPTSWQWTITGGTPPVTTTENPSATFAAAGYYAVKLRVSNAYGSDSITKYVHVVSTVTMCSGSTTSAQTTTALSGTLYDSGGPLGYYSNYENCSVLISPAGVCTDSIVLTITSFSTESCCDYLRIYNGTSTLGTLVFTGYGSLTVPYRVKVPSGNMFISWYSDGSGTYPGYAANWQAYQHSSAAPTAGFNISNATPPLFDTVRFTNTSSATASSYSWIFGDGSSSILQNPTHAYTASGTYTVTLIATACGGASDTIRRTVTVQATPQVSFAPASLSVGLGCDDTTDLSLIIRNNGGGQLNWNVLHGATASSSSTPNMLVWLYGVDVSTGGEYQHTMAAINQYYSNYNLTTTTTTTPSVLQAALAGKQILLIPELETGNSSIVAGMASLIQAFVSAGGTLIQCGDGGGVFLSDGVFTGSTYYSISTGYAMTLANTTTPLTNGIPTGSSLFTQNATTGAVFTNTNKVSVVTYNTYDVATYVPYGSGKGIYLAFDYFAYDTIAAKLISNAVRWGAQSAGAGTSSNIQTAPDTGSALAGEQDTIHVSVNSHGLSGGLDTLYVYVQTNDSAHRIDTIPVYVSVSNMPCPSFGYVQASACSGIVQFRDSSLNHPTAWSWSFGDGGTSTVQNPSHTYTAAGTYTVWLRVTNATGTDSVSRQITLTSVSGPIAASCTPVATSPSSGYGILNVQLNTINNTSGYAIEGYKDFTCTQFTTLSAGSQYQLRVTTGYVYENVKVWLDLNGDGVLSTTEVIATPVTGSTAHLSVISIPATGVQLNTPLRMRVMSDYYSLSTACTNPYYGQAEDYTVTITNATAPPVANFTMSDTVIAVGATEYFTDLSTNGPTAWRWTISTGTPGTSTTQNPTATFPSAGYYPVKLVASNAYGSDSIIKWVHVVSTVNMCTGTTSTTAPSGTLYDSGGPLGSYSNYENCSLLINPGGNCTDSIVLTFTAFSTESCCDYLRIYNGTSAAGTLLFTGNGTLTVPFSVKVPSATAFISWYSDGSAVYSGYAANWQVYQHSGTPPVAAFSASTITPPLLDTVFFTNTSSATATTYNWDFGDGGSSVLTSPNHIYTAPGTYTVTLIASSCGGAADTVRHTVTVQAAPVVSFAPSSLSVGLGCNDTTDLSIVIRNTAGGQLDWNVLQGSSSAGRANMLVWIAGADTSIGGEYRNTMAAIAQYYTGYNVATTNTVSASMLQSLLSGKQILLIPEMENGSTTMMATMATTIQSFVSAGGTLIQCGDNGGYDLYNGILAGSVSSVSAGYSMSIVNTTTPLTTGITATYATSLNATYPVNLTNSNKVQVVTYGAYDVVSYVPYGSGKAIFLAYDFYSYDSTAAHLVSNAVRWGAQMSSSGYAGSANLQASPLSGDALAGQQDTIHVSVNSSGLHGGLDTLYVYIRTNESANHIDTVPVYVSVSPAPCPAFGYSRLSACSGIVQFFDSSLNNPTSWRWSFGDGSTSAVRNPGHTYAASGIYTVTLIVSSSYGTDSITRVITLGSTTGPIATTCASPTIYSDPGYGIGNFTIGTINNSSGSSIEGYQDYTCTALTYLTIGQSYTFTITNSGFYGQYYSLFVDYNNDGTFSASEQVLSNAYSSTGYYTGTYTVPNTTNVNVPLRARVVAGYYQYTACSSISYGQAEDYTFILVGVASRPVCNFTASPLTVYVNQPVQFTDQSLGYPAVWAWTLSGATPATSTAQNPTATYAAVGTYTAKLRVGNSYGSDSLTRTAYVRVIPLPALQIADSVNFNCQHYFTTDLPSPYTTVRWNFGDGQTLNSSNHSILHNYAANGTYQVTAISVSPYGNDTVYMTVSYTNTTYTPSAAGSMRPGQNIVFSVTPGSSVVSYTWDFGDGSATSNLATPTHAYAASGVYIYTVSVIEASGCQKTVYDTVTIIGTGIADISDKGLIKVYPNPTQDHVTIDFTGMSDFTLEDVQVSDALGQIVLHQSGSAVHMKDKKVMLDLSFAAGVYYIKVRTDKGSLVKEVVKQ